MLNLKTKFGKLYKIECLFAGSSVWSDFVLQILREHQGLHAVYLLKTDKVDGVLGEAVVSESENEIRLHEIFIKPEYRGRGYGEALMKAVLSYGEAKLVTLCTSLGNIPFFERYGFEVTNVSDSLISMERRP